MTVGVQCNTLHGYGSINFDRLKDSGIWHILINFSFFRDRPDRFALKQGADQKSGGNISKLRSFFPRRTAQFNQKEGKK
jgi:hypothetical protein